MHRRPRSGTRRRMRALAAPTSLKSVLSATAAADALAAGLRAGGAEAVAMPVADGGDGTLDVLGGEPRVTEVSAPLGGRVSARWSLLDDRTAVVESAQALGFATVDRLDPLRASSRGLGELVLAAAREARALLVCLGGTVTVDGGAGLREVLDELPLPTRVACDVMAPLADAVDVYAAQKGARPEDLPALRERLRGLPDVAGAGAVDDTTFAGKAPGEVVRRCREAGVRCELVSARDDLSSDPSRAAEDLFELARSLAHSLR